MWESTTERDLLLEELSITGSIRQKECRWRNRRGETFTILLSAETITLDNTPHILCLDLDITERKKAEVEILKALTRERELSQLKSNFVSMVSHEFRTPLGIIQSSAELLRAFYQKMEPDERAEQLQAAPLPPTCKWGVLELATRRPIRLRHTGTRRSLRGSQGR